MTEWKKKSFSAWRWNSCPEAVDLPAPGQMDVARMVCHQVMLKFWAGSPVPLADGFMPGDCQEKPLELMERGNGVAT